MPRLIRAAAILAAAAALLLAKPAQAQTQRTYLDEIDLTSVTAGWKNPRPNKAVDYDTIRIAGKSYPRGVGTHAACIIELDLHGTATRFHSVVGVDDKVAKPAQESPMSAKIRFAAIADGVVLFQSDTMRPGKAATIDIDLRNRKTLFLVVDALKNPWHDHADFADAWFEHTGARPAVVSPYSEKPYILTPKVADRPQYNGPARYGARPGNPILWRLPFSGRKPITITQSNLPPGLRINPRTGVITGKVAKAGKYPITVTASNAVGKATAKATLVIGDTLLLTPPLGWNSWNAWGMDVRRESILQAARAMDQKLADFGWTYVNIDDGWEAGRDAQGRIQANEKFGNMKALADSVHARGLKVGLYSSPGPTTCGKMTGSYQHEAQDARSYADWGFDYLKYDWCSYSQIYDKLPAGERSPQAPYKLMGGLLRNSGRDIVFSLCQYGHDSVSKWGPHVGGQLWRTTGDIVDNWVSMYDIAVMQPGLERYAGPGRWNDPDMLVIGKLGWSSKLHPTRLTPSEQYYHISMWSILSAPMLLGCDLTQLDDFTLNLITNREVLAVNQDALGRQGRLIYSDSGAFIMGRPSYIQVFQKELADGTIALGIFNQGSESTTYRFDPIALDLTGIFKCRDLWRQQDLQGYNPTLTIPRHGAALLKLTPAPMGKKKRS